MIFNMKCLAVFIMVANLGDVSMGIRCHDCTTHRHRTACDSDMLWGLEQDYWTTRECGPDEVCAKFENFKYTTSTNAESPIHIHSRQPHVPIERIGVVRGCAPTFRRKDILGGCTRIGLGGNRFEVRCYCNDTDLCNESSGLWRPQITMLVAAIIFLVTLSF